MQGALSIERMCYLARVSRAGFYRWLAQQEPDLEEMEIRSAIQSIAVEHHRRYGYRRITAELRLRGMVVNHKRVAAADADGQPTGCQEACFCIHDELRASV